MDLSSAKGEAVERGSCFFEIQEVYAVQQSLRKGGDSHVGVSSKQVPVQPVQLGHQRIHCQSPGIQR